MKPSEFDSPDPIAWCPGCGNFGIRQAVKTALAELAIEPWQVCFVSGIGQAAKAPHYVRCNLFNGLHGRALPVAQGIRLAHSELKVIAEGGDGDGYAEGGNHFLHALRRNSDITYLVHDNRIYGLTKGQTSPTSDIGTVSATTPTGSFEPAFNPLALAVALDAGLVARGFADDAEELSGLIAQAVRHRGFALIDILQPCPSFNRVNTHQWYQHRISPVGPDHDPTDRARAFDLAFEWGERIPTGVLYRSRRPCYEDMHLIAGRARLGAASLDAIDLAGLFSEFV